ncbi:AraC family transcriptional regulator [Paenibacillus harenae]|uniref:AraC-like DNA-binding protein n=1 Tax=Paenibacillus harenae TaxID=306543 RepID=A0ABT9TX31_PAEHA|nr:AraC family transcriptional regulator [Paenibacillus harenae]MDQ0111916.1 AraC-like DNA-binding protein [Paenibacillus harenae]
MKHTDLQLNQYGTQQCLPGHCHGPDARDHYLLHYVLDGEGIFESGGRTYRLRRGQGFLISPGEINYYEADSSKPWHYCWLGFHGAQAESLLIQANLMSASPIFTYDRDDLLYRYMEQIIHSKDLSRSRDLRLTGLLYMLLSLLVETGSARLAADKKENRKEQYVKQVIDFIELNYASKISVSRIAYVIGLDRSYLCSIFKASIRFSIQDYLILYRINKACELIEHSELSIGDISRSVGYDDPLLFSKIFKKTKGLSPRQFRGSLVKN